MEQTIDSITDQFKKFKVLANANGYSISAMKELETPFGLTATWTVRFNGKIIAKCHDAGDGSCLRYIPVNKSQLVEFERECQKVFAGEPLESGLLALGF